MEIKKLDNETISQMINETVATLIKRNRPSFVKEGHSTTVWVKRDGDVVVVSLFIQYSSFPVVKKVLAQLAEEIGAEKIGNAKFKFAA